MEREAPQTPPTVNYRKNTKMDRFNKGTRQNSEALGISFSVIFVWLVNDVMGVDIPMEVMGAFLTSLGIIVGRFHDAV